MRTTFALLLGLLPLNLHAYAGPRTLTCDGVTFYDRYFIDGGTTLMSMQYTSAFLNRRKLRWGAGDVHRDPKDPWVIRAYPEFGFGGATLAPSVRTRRTPTGDLVAEVSWFNTEIGNYLSREVPCVFDAPLTFRQDCGQLLVLAGERLIGER